MTLSLTDGLLQEIRFHGESAPRLANTVNFAVPGLPGETLAIALDLAGFAVSTGSACASGAVEPSPALAATGMAPDEALSSIRVSLGTTSTADEVDRFLAALAREAAALRDLMPAAAAGGTR